MSATATRNLVAVSSEIPEENLRGYITFFSMPDDPVPADELIREALKNGLDDKYLPDLREPVHVFQSACASVASRNGNGHGRVEVRSDEVENSPDQCSYQITRVVWDLDNHVIEHEKALRLEFSKKDQAVRSVRLDHFDPALEDLENQVREHYEANMSTIPGSKIRNMVRDVLRRCGGIGLRRNAGGVYFVPTTMPGTATRAGGKRTKPLLDGLSGMLEGLYQDRGDLWTVPCMAGDAEDAMIKRHATLNIVQEARRISQKAFQRLQTSGDRKVRDDFAANLANDRRTIMQLMAHFEELVGLNKQDVEASLKELDSAIQQIEAAAR